MIPFLPFEIIRLVLEHLAPRISSLDTFRRRDLVRCCSTSKLFESVAQPLLYKHLEIRQLVAVHYDSPEPRYYTDRCGSLLIEAFERNERLCHLVKELTIRGVRGGDFWHAHREQESLGTLANFIRRLLGLKVIVLDNLAHIPRLEQVVAREQDRWGRLDSVVMPILRVKGDGYSYQFGTIRLRARYEGYNSGIICPGHVDWSSTLASSRHTLKRLNIPFDANVSLTTFTQLEFLSLGLSNPCSKTPISSLIGTLTGLLHLRYLVFRVDSLDRSIHPILDARQRGTSSPPSLSHLSLDVRMDAGDLLAFLRTSTNPQRLSYRGETSKAEDIVQECKKEGIRLSLNQKWEIW